MLITYRGIEMVPIQEAARMTRKTVQTMRYLLEDRSSKKGMVYFQDGCHRYIPLAILKGYDYGEPGVISPIGHNVYHYDADGSGYFLTKRYCDKCTLTPEGCELAQEARRVAEEVASWES